MEQEMDLEIQVIYLKQIYMKSKRFESNSSLSI